MLETARNTRPSLEMFFTPWHPALYSGMLATAAWTAVVIWRNRTAGQGFSLFLILGTAVRSARASHFASPDDHPASTPAALFAVVLMTGLGAFFLIYVSAFVRPGPTALFVPTPFGSPGRVQSELPVVITLASYLLTTALIIAPFLFTLSAARRPARGVVTLLVAAAAWLPVAMLGLHRYSIAGAAGATIAAVVADLLLARLPATWLRKRLPAVTGGIAAVLWTGQLVAFAVTDAIRWPVSLWPGAAVLRAAVAAASPSSPPGVRRVRCRTPPRGCGLSPPKAEALHNDRLRCWLSGHRRACLGSRRRTG